MYTHIHFNHSLNGGLVHTIIWMDPFVVLRVSGAYFSFLCFLIQKPAAYRGI